MVVEQPDVTFYAHTPRASGWRALRASLKVPAASFSAGYVSGSPLLREIPGKGIRRHAITECFRAHLKRLLTVHSPAEDDQVGVTMAGRAEDRGFEVGIFAADRAACRQPFSDSCRYRRRHARWCALWAPQQRRGQWAGPPGQALPAAGFAGPAAGAGAGGAGAGGGVAGWLAVWEAVSFAGAGAGLGQNSQPRIASTTTANAPYSKRGFRGVTAGSSSSSSGANGRGFSAAGGGVVGR